MTKDETHDSTARREFSRREFLQRSGQVGIAALALPAAICTEARDSEAIPASEDGYEYAAGPVTLPFSYQVVRSPAPRPDGLNFSQQLGPDNCQVFIRIDDELWEFRSQWIINLGTVARYKGPDIDHMARAEDGIYPNGMTACWFLGGMWYDKSEGKLYAPMHIEHDGPRRRLPFSRKIALGTSTDKGLTWKYEGDIITSENYYYTHDFPKFSGSSYGSGVADFGFYADERGGYFYVFPDEGWAPRSTRGTRFNTRAVRCAIHDKMAPGKWKYFYEGQWEEPALGGKSSSVAPGHFWAFTYSTVLKKYICMFPGNQDPPDSSNIDGVYIGCCSDLGKQDWIWGYCPDAMFGFMNLMMPDGTDIASICAGSFRFYSYFGSNDFQRLDVKLSSGETLTTDLQLRYLFDSHPESSDPMLGRNTKIVSSRSSDMKYTGAWNDHPAAGSYQGVITVSSTPNASVEYSFEGSDIYWRALHSPDSGKAEIYIDGALRKTVDCYSPRSTSYEQFLYIKKGLRSGIRHTIKVVVTGEKHNQSTSATIGHVAFEVSAKSYRASAGFSALMGKNNWFYQESKESDLLDLLFLADEANPAAYWYSSRGSQIGTDYQIPGESRVIRKWVAPCGGVIRIEGTVACPPGTSAGIHLNTGRLWPAERSPVQTTASHDVTATVIQGDAVSFEVAGAGTGKSSNPGSSKVIWDPVITYTQNVPAVWQPNPPSGQNFSLNKSARSKVLVTNYRPFDAVDGDPNTAFTLHGDDALSSGEDWLQVDLENRYLIDHYVVSSQTGYAAYRPSIFTLQKSDDGFLWTDVDTVNDAAGSLEQYYGIPMSRTARPVPAFRARYVRLYLPRGKPFTISEFALYYTEGKGTFGPPAPAG
jgi:NedA-like, galactose-binding domain